MINPDGPARPQTRLQAKAHRTRREAQWLAPAFAALLLLATPAAGWRAFLPGASPPLFFAALGLLGAAAVALIPPLYWRLPRLLKRGGWLLFLAAFVTWCATASDMQRAYDHTPEGAQEIAAQIKREEIAAKAQEARDRTQQLLDEGAAQQKQWDDYKAKAEACFSWSHRLPALENPVRDSLENPHSFEHVKTELIDPDENHNNVMMTFRAQNGFGAIRTARVLAQLVADDCTVQNIGQPQED